MVGNYINGVIKPKQVFKKNIIKYGGGKDNIHWFNQLAVATYGAF